MDHVGILRLDDEDEDGNDNEDDVEASSVASAASLGSSEDSSSVIDEISACAVSRRMSSAELGIWPFGKEVDNSTVASLHSGQIPAPLPYVDRSCVVNKECDCDDNNDSGGDRFSDGTFTDSSFVLTSVVLWRLHPRGT
mmetsp:Transcript_6364/g.17331  ORF Transcript_6364/g.17331 Transcript_6364/m.17331 type:complete len:139 (-) Transcript_6364:197-613(-)